MPLVIRITNRELEQIADSKSKVYDILNSSDRFNDDDDDIFNRISVKVLTKDGVVIIETNKVNMRENFSNCLPCLKFTKRENFIVIFFNFLICHIKSL